MLVVIRFALAVLRPIRNVTDLPYRNARVDAVMAAICHVVMLAQMSLHHHASGRYGD
jgi:hypothetical protein